MTTGVLTQLIDAAILTGNIKSQEVRDYIGASSIGNSCERSIWYRYNQAPQEPISPKLQRTFSIGKRLEGIVLDCLEQAGVNLSRTWYDLKDADVSVFQGHVDAMWLMDDGSPKAVIEVKTARDSSFKVFASRGLKYWYPVYYAQIQAYMGMSGVGEAYVIALNKDTSELHDEHVLFDVMFYEDLKRKAVRIAEADEPPEKINNSPMFYVCRGCSFKGICHS
jgi:hypothetical protein